jgi:hypothetical protein
MARCGGRPLGRADQGLMAFLGAYGDPAALRALARTLIADSSPDAAVVAVHRAAVLDAAPAAIDADAALLVQAGRLGAARALIDATRPRPRPP